jgi:hypothetical protein
MYFLHKKRQVFTNGGWAWSKPSIRIPNVPFVLALLKIDWIWWGFVGKKGVRMCHLFIFKFIYLLIF